MEICIDFDGTCVTHEYPLVGKDIGADVVLKKLVSANHKLILFTMRSGTRLQDAVNWLKENEIPLYGVNENPAQKQWTQSPKAYGQIYIDDAALGCPLKFTEEHKRPFVDWVKVSENLVLNGILPNVR